MKPNSGLRIQYRHHRDDSYSGASCRYIDYSTLDQSLSIQKIWQNECGEESNLQINEHPDNNQLLQPIKTDSPCQPKDLQFENTSHSNLQCFMLFLSTNGGAQVEVGDSSAKIITDVVASPNVSLAD